MAKKKIKKKNKKLLNFFGVLRAFWFCVISRGQYSLLKVCTYAGELESVHVHTGGRGSKFRVFIAYLKIISF